MSERDGFEHGVPSWIAVAHPDPRAAASFYSDLFGWEAEEILPADWDGSYLVCRQRGLEVAAIGSAPAGAAPPEAGMWVTHVWVDDTDATAAKVTEAGGSIVIDPFDLGVAGRTAVVTDSVGAAFALWQPRELRGARVVNEPGAWAMSMLATTDPEAAKRFYGEVFGWEADDFEGLWLWRLPGFVGGEPAQPVPRDVIGAMMPAEGRPPSWDVNFWVDDADESATQAAKLGGTVLVEPFDSQVTRDAVLADPQGAVVSVSTAPGP
jgi:predicted enzyme related to lactoylglutathione lyase